MAGTDARGRHKMVVPSGDSIPAHPLTGNIAISRRWSFLRHSNISLFLSKTEDMKVLLELFRSRLRSKQGSDKAQTWKESMILLEQTPFWLLFWRASWSTSGCENRNMAVQVRNLYTCSPNAQIPVKPASFLFKKRSACQSVIYDANIMRPNAVRQGALNI